MRKYTLNEFYFDVIDNEAKAYFLGFLYADGNHCVKKNRITIGLQERDKYILEEFNRMINSNRPIVFKSKELLNKRKGFTNCQNQYYLNINSKHMSQSLLKLGLFNNKTFILKFPTEDQVPEFLQSHFIRGYIDGDGCVEKKGVSFMGTFDFCSKIKEIAKNKLNVNFYYRFKCTYPISEFTLKNKSARTFLKWIYQDSTIYLKRKYLRFLEQLQYEHDIKKLRLCCVEGCNTLQRSMNYCQHHYDQVRKKNKIFELKKEIIWIKCPNM